MATFGVLVTWLGEEFVIGPLDRLHVRDLAGDDDLRRGEMHVDALVVLEHLLDPAGLLDARELKEEVGVEEDAAELAVGYGFEAEPLLPFDEIGDGLVLDGAQFGGVDLSGSARLTGVDDGFRAQKRADMVGPRRQLGSHVEVLSWQRMDL